jgi:hypothetical protein
MLLLYFCLYCSSFFTFAALVDHCFADLLMTDAIDDCFVVNVIHRYRSV